MSILTIVTDLHREITYLEQIQETLKSSSLTRIKDIEKRCADDVANETMLTQALIGELAALTVKLHQLIEEKP
jgi:hypothetical protein